MTYVIAQPCVDVKDKACIEECPVDCIYEGERMLYIHPDECVDCGACEPVCPVEAIYYEDDVPSEWSDYYKANVEFFDDVGSPGGAAKVGVIPKDHPWSGRKDALSVRLRLRNSAHWAFDVTPRANDRSTGVTPGREASDHPAVRWPWLGIENGIRVARSGR